MPVKEDIHRQLEDFRTEYAEIQRGVHEKVTDFLAKTVVYVHNLSSDERALILEHPYFSSRKYAASKNKILLHYFCCIMDARCDLVYKQASSYARALAHLYSQVELDDATVRDELEEHGGVESLRRHVQVVEANAKIGLEILHLESDEQLLSDTLDMCNVSEITIKARPEADGKGGGSGFGLLRLRIPRTKKLNSAAFAKAALSFADAYFQDNPFRPQIGIQISKFGLTENRLSQRRERFASAGK